MLQKTHSPTSEAVSNCASVLKLTWRKRKADIWSASMMAWPRSTRCYTDCCSLAKRFLRLKCGTESGLHRRRPTLLSSPTILKNSPRLSPQRMRIGFTSDICHRRDRWKLFGVKGSDLHISIVSKFVVPHAALMQFGTEVSHSTAGSLKSVCDRGRIHLRELRQFSNLRRFVQPTRRTQLPNSLRSFRPQQRRARSGHAHITHQITTARSNRLTCCQCDSAAASVSLTACNWGLAFAAEVWSIRFRRIAI